jgi:formate hydrogenlyase subunit 3/multisubunit Na+/H+ antiporter MnhD subunit
VNASGFIDGLMLATIAVPLIMAAAIVVSRESSRPVVITPLAGLPALALALFGPSGAELEIPGLFKHTVLMLDETARVFLGFTSVLYMVAAWYARSYLEDDRRATRFFVLFLLAMAGNLGLILAADVPTFFASFAIMGLASAGLVSHRIDDETRRASRIYLALTMVGEVVILTGLVFLVVEAGTTEIAALHGGPVSGWGTLLITAGFGIKAGALTLHFWLPLAHPAAPIPASAVLSGTMIKAGLLGWIRFLPLGEAAVPQVGYVFMSAGVAAALLGAVAGVMQNNPKTVLAYSSISQMGIIMTGLGIGALHPEAWPAILTAVLIYTAHHALAKGALFLGIGPAQKAESPRELIVVRCGMLLPALALAGAPFTSGALAKVALKSNLEFLPESWAGALGVLLPVAAVGTSAMMIRLLSLIWSPASPPSAARTKGLWAPWLSLVAATVVGVWLLPGALGWVPAKLTPEKLWTATWPLIVGGGMAALGARLQRTLAADPASWIPAGDFGVLLERLLGRITRGLRLPPPAGDGHEYCDPQTVSETEAPPRLTETRCRMMKIESALAEWPVVGLTLSSCGAVLIWLVACSIG